MVKLEEVIKIGDKYFNKEDVYKTLLVRCKDYSLEEIEDLPQ